MGRCTQNLPVSPYLYLSFYPLHLSFTINLTFLLPMNTAELPVLAVEFPPDIILSASRLFQHALDLRNGPGADLRAAARILYGICLLHCDLARPFLFLTQLYFQGTMVLEESLEEWLTIVR